MIKIFDYDQVSSTEIFSRGAESADEPRTKCTTVRDARGGASGFADIEKAVADIIADVRANGDAALKKYNAEFDGNLDENLEVTESEIESAFAALEPEFIGILEQAAANIRAFHERQVRHGFMISDLNNNGVMLGQKLLPIEKVGLYIPGGTAAYPSSVLMNCIPAKIAGCGEIIITSPAKNSKLNPAILAAAKIAGADRIFKIGGAQAIAALAYGTESVPRVYKITGPGNAFVAEAKRQVFGHVAIDMIAGPSEILVVADKTCDAGVVAADMLSQAEHDRLASAVLVTDSKELAESVRDELERQLAALPRQEIARASIENNGKIIIAKNLEVAIDIANEIAPEHLELCVDNPFDYLGRVKNAGSVFLGKNCPEALGDYFAGPNHTLPTSGSAKFSSALSVDDFIKKTQYIYYTADALSRVSDKVAYFAEKEGLSGHARSAVIRDNIKSEAK